MCSVCEKRLTLVDENIQNLQGRFDSVGEHGDFLELPNFGRELRKQEWSTSWYLCRERVIVGVGAASVTFTKGSKTASVLEYVSILNETSSLWQ
jgi:hypothetical protein